MKINGSEFGKSLRVSSLKKLSSDVFSHRKNFWWLMLGKRAGLQVFFVMGYAQCIVGTLLQARQQIVLEQILQLKCFIEMHTQLT